MKKIINCMLLMGLTANPASADLLTVDNNPGAVAMFSSVAEAIAAASDKIEDRDTILIAGSPNVYDGGSSLDCFKPITFVGAGYLLEKNDIPGVTQHPSRVVLRFKTDAIKGDSSGSKCIGLTGIIVVDPDVTGINIDKCYNNGNNWTFNGSATIQRTFHNGGNLTLTGPNCAVYNSIVRSLILNHETALVSNCVIINRIQAINDNPTGPTLVNSILMINNLANWDEDVNVTYSLNVGLDVIPPGTGNITDGKIATDVFTTATGSTDNEVYFELAGDPGSNDAIGGGQDGEDMGVFGGVTPHYVFSGVPGIPRLTHVSVPGIATGESTMSIQIDASAYPE